MSKEFRHFGALKNGNGFGIAVDEIDPLEEAQINESLRDLKSSIRGIKYHPKYYPRGGKMLNAWTIPADLEAIEPMLEIVDRFGFKRNPSAENLIKRIFDTEEQRKQERDINRNLSSAQTGPDIHVPGLNGELRGYQKAAVSWILRNRKVYIGDEMGTGKTCVSLSAIVADGATPAVVVCPASVKIGWKRQIEKFFPDLVDNVYVCGGRMAKPIPENTKFILINYDILSNWLGSIQRYGYKAVVLDEAHLIKSRKARRTRASIVLAQRAEMRIAMSGTPLISRPIDLVSQLEALGRMDDMTQGRRTWWFIERYCRPVHNGYGWDTGGASNLFELSDRLRTTGILIRRRKEDVLTELPPKQRVSIPLEISNRKDYEKVEASIGHWIRDQIGADAEFQNYLKTLPKAQAEEEWRKRIDERILKAQSALAITKLSALRQMVMRGKIGAATDWIEDFLTSEEKLVVFCTHREASDHLYKRFDGAAVRIIGGMSADARQRAIDSFVDDDSIRLVIANIDAAAEGIDGWQNVCSNVAFLELTWTPTKHHQAEDRCHRSGQQNPVTCYYLMAEDTIDEYLARLIDGKKAVISAAIDGERVEKSDAILADLFRRLSHGEF